MLSDAIEGLPQQPEWVGLPAVGRVESTRLVGDKTTMEGRYYLGSFMELARFAEAARGHGDIENEQHWILDVHSVRTPTDRARTIWQKIWP